MSTITAVLEETKVRPLYKVGDRVEYVVQFNNPSESMPPDRKVPGTIIFVFYGPTQPPTYKIELDICWAVSNRVGVHHRGKKIIIGNIQESVKRLIPLSL